MIHTHAGEQPCACGYMATACRYSIHGIALVSYSKLPRSMVIRETRVFSRKRRRLTKRKSLHLYSLDLPKHKVGNHEGHSRPEIPAVAGLSYFRVRFFAVRIIIDGGQGPVPPGARRHLEQQDEGLKESLEVMHIVEATPDLDILEEGHAEDGEDEHDEEEEEADVQEGGHGHDQGEEEGADALGAFDET
jgi:hypothetical protein